MDTQYTEQPPGFRSILIVDDHPLYCEALAATLGRIFPARQIKSASQFADVLAIGFQPDLVLLDLRLPDVQGLSGFMRLREMMPDVPVVVISAEASEEQMAAIRAMGGAGYISKSAPPEDLESLLRRVQHGEHCFPEGTGQAGPDAQEAADQQDILRRIADLTPQQTRILRLIGAGKPNKQIAYELSLAEATVKAHVTALLRRLGVRNRTQAALLLNGQHGVSAPKVMPGLH